MKKQKILAKYLPETKKRKQKSTSNILMRDEEIVNQVQSSESEQPQGRVFSSDEQQPKEQKNQHIKNKAQRKIRKMIRKKLSLARDEDVDEFISNLQIQGIGLEEVAEHLRSNKTIKMQMQTKPKKQKKGKYKMFEEKQQSSDLQIPQQARTVYRSKDGTIRGYSDKVAKQKHKEQVQSRLNQWQKGMKKQSSESENDEDYQRAKHVNIWDDPMKRWQTQKLLKPLACKYDGPPNRFNIRPGYRWDGVIRGNGFQNKLIQQKNLSKAKEDKEYQEYLKNL